MILSRNILNYLKEGKTLEEACAKAGVVQNELNIWKLWADKGLQPYADFFREIQKDGALNPFIKRSASKILDVDLGETIVYKENGQ